LPNTSTNRTAIARFPAPNPGAVLTSNLDSQQLIEPIFPYSKRTISPPLARDNSAAWRILTNCVATDPEDTGELTPVATDSKKCSHNAFRGSPSAIGIDSVSCPRGIK